MAMTSPLSASRVKKRIILAAIKLGGLCKQYSGPKLQDILAVDAQTHIFKSWHEQARKTKIT